MASMMVTAIAMALGLLFVGIILFNVHWGNPLSVLLVVVLLGISIAALSVIIGTWARSQEQAIATAVIVAIIAGMLGGCVYQLDTVSTTVRQVGHIVPQAWAMDTFVKLIYDHATFTDTLPAIGALAAFAVGLSVLAVVVLLPQGVLDGDLTGPVTSRPRHRPTRAPVPPAAIEYAQLRAAAVRRSHCRPPSWPAPETSPRPSAVTGTAAPHLNQDEPTDLSAQVMFDDPYPTYAALRRTQPRRPGVLEADARGSRVHAHPPRARPAPPQRRPLLERPGRQPDREEDGASSSFLMRHLPKMFRLLTQSMVYKDDPDHARLRRLVNKAFTPRRVQSSRPKSSASSPASRRGRTQGPSGEPSTSSRGRRPPPAVGHLGHARRRRRGP